MSIKDKKKKETSIIFKVLAFVATFALILWVFPREGSFRYEFHEGQPWRYGLLKAKYDFPIYKSDDAIKAEKDSLLANFEPYVQQDRVKLEEVKKQLREDYESYLCLTVPRYYINYLTEQFDIIYKAGIISASQMSEFEKKKVKGIVMVSDNVGEHRSISSLFTAKKAYSAILSNLPVGINDSILLNEFDLERYILENCTYDQSTSAKRREEMLHNVSETFGMVQKDERIVDQGEIITHETYLKLSSLKRASGERSITVGGYWILAGQTLWIALMLGFLFVYLRRFYPEIFGHLHTLNFVLVLILILCVLTSLVIRNDEFLNIYMIPYALLPILLCTFYDSRVAIFATMVTILICAPITPFPFEFLMVQMAMGFTAILTLKDFTQRSQLALCILGILIAYCFSYTSLSMLQQGGVDQVQWITYVSFIVNALLLLSSYLLIYLSEWAFGFTSNVTLMELANINSPLLRQFSEICPGTFQHSLQVSNLAAAAASAIGANSLLVRTGALYHDLGKMANPQYFTENQDGANPLSSMPADKAVRFITGHVIDGMKLAEEHHLPKVLRDFITTHHGSGPARYFYTLFKNEHPKEDAPSYYFYQGPDPSTRETAILMMADTIEAASHSMKEYTESSIDQLVEDLIGRQISAGSFKDVPITLQEIEVIKKEMKSKLRGMYHTRISYPKEVTSR